MARTDHEHNTSKLLHTINDLADQCDRLTGRLADAILSREALDLALAATAAYGREQYARAEHLASVYTETAASLQAEIQHSQALEAELAEVRANFAAARPVDSRDARNARLRSM